ncbi:cytochrome P450 [Nocardia sp. NPDC056000]|uniref:cytochrome P450 n=1 Tax=Nocardia sp. NPDC056000 TaxID=3345674 RepID=UPI0035E33ECD
MTSPTTTATPVRRDRRGRQPKPPFPRGIMGTFARIAMSGTRPAGAVDADLATSELNRYGHILTGPGIFLPKPLRFLTRRIAENSDGEELMITSPRGVREFYSHGRDDIDHEIVKDMYLRFGLGTYSPFLLDGPAHVAARRALTPELTQAAVEQYREMSIEVLDRILDELPVGEPVAMHDVFYGFTQEVILRVVLGLTDQAEIDDAVAVLHRFVRIGTNSMLRFWPVTVALMLAQPRAKRFGDKPMDRVPLVRRKVDRLLARKIAEFRADPSDACIGSRIVKARLTDDTWTDKKFADLFRTLLFAGHETSVSAYSWALDLLLHNTPERELLIAEARAAETDTYAQACNNETLRMHSPFWAFGGMARRDLTVDGYRVREGAAVFTISSAVHYDPQAYPSPYEFRPERFLDKTPDRFGFVPFGVGKHRCPGMNFYMIEANIVLHRIFGRLDLRPAGPPERGHVALGALTRPSRGMKVLIDHRRPAGEVPCYRATTQREREQVAAMRAPIPEDFPVDSSPVVPENVHPAGAPMPAVCPVTGARA